MIRVEYIVVSHHRHILEESRVLQAMLQRLLHKFSVNALPQK